MQNTKSWCAASKVLVTIASFLLPPVGTRWLEQAMQKQTIAITATFTAEPIEESLSFWMQELDISSEIEFAPYNQVFQQLLDPASLLS
ncbi:MAG: hypothetical protein LC776_07060, partial [Acidobacteria bacterium]|nr:hypothetical protein [Acidobacteriota bacterium]